MKRKGLVGVAKFGIVLCSLTLLVVMSTIGFVDVMSLMQSKPNSTFAAYCYFNNTTTNLFINWSSGANVTVEAYVNHTAYKVNNATSAIYGIYWQNSSFYLPNTYSNLTSSISDLPPSTYGSCFALGDVTGSMGFAVQNNISNTFNETTINITNSTGPVVNSTLFNLTYYAFCPPGTYHGNFTVVDFYNTSNKVNLTATIMIPLSYQNTLNVSAWNYTAFIHGRIPPNATYYHSYYFNPDLITNATSVTINMSGFSTTLGIYLIHQNGSVLAQAENSSSVEIPYIKFNGSMLDKTSDMFELRVYGNFSTGSLQTYHINFYFSHINITDEAANKPVDLLDFGMLTPNSTSTSMNFTLANVGAKNISGINQTAEFYWIKRWSNRNDNPSNFSIIVPNFTSKIEVILEWRNVTRTTNFTNISDWDLFLIDPNSKIVASSTNNFMNSNFSNATATESIIYGGFVFNSSNTGIWNITVNRSNSSTSNVFIYNVTTRIWFNTTSWINTNFTQNTTLNMSGEQNSSRHINVSITLPQTQLMNGLYEGYIQYSNAGTNGEGWKVRLPLKFNVSTGLLVINNSIYNTTIRIHENTGLYRKLNFNISVQNLGGTSIVYNMSNSSNLTYGTSYMNFTIDTYNQVNHSGILIPSENKSINITVVVNTSNTGNTQGLYTGWITFNVTQNNTNNISIHNIFSISVEVNLTNNLVVNISQYYTGDISNYNPFINVTNNTQNITMLINVSLQNGTVLSNNVYQMNGSNFTSVTIREGNVTTYSVSLTNIRDGQAVPCTAGGFCMINATVPAGIPGGRYNLYATARWNTTNNENATSVILTSTGGTYPLTIYDPGFQIAVINSSTDVGMGEYIDKTINVSITNYGPKTASSGIISMNNTCIYVVINASSSGNINGTCSLPATTSNNFFTVSSIPGNGTSCWMAFNIHSVNVSGSKSCISGSINLSTSALSFNYIDTFTVSIGDTDGTSGGTGSTGGSTGTSYTYNRSVRLMSYNTNYTAKLGENISATVTVKNTGNTTSIVWLAATTNNSNITTASDPSFISLGSGATGSYAVYMNISNSSRIGLFSGTFKAYAEGYADTWYDTKQFNLTVEATAERKAELNLSYANYTTQLANLTTVFNAIKASGLVDIGNLTKVGELFNATSDIVQRINDAINSSNYALAESLIIDLAGRIARIQEEMSNLEASKAAGEQKFAGDLMVWIIIGLVIAGAAGVVIYMLLPPKQGARRLKFPALKKSGNAATGRFGGIKRMLRRKEKGSIGAQKKGEGANIAEYAEMKKSGEIEYAHTSRYAEGYERSLHKKGKRRASRGFASRIKSLFKRSPKGQEKLSDFAKKK